MKSIAWGAYVAYSVKDLERAAQQMWSVSDAAAPEASLQVGVVPTSFQDDAIDYAALQAQVSDRASVSHRRAGRPLVQASSYRQCA